MIGEGNSPLIPSGYAPAADTHTLQTVSQSSPNLHAAVVINSSFQGVYFMRRGSTRHPSSERYGLALTLLFVWQLSVYLAQGCRVEIASSKILKYM